MEIEQVVPLGKKLCSIGRVQVSDGMDRKYAEPYIASEGMDTSAVVEVEDTLRIWRERNTLHSAFRGITELCKARPKSL